MREETIYQIALSFVDGIGSVHAKNLLEHFKTAADIFHAPTHRLSAVEGIGTVRAKAIKDFKGFDLAEAEYAFCIKQNIQPLFVTHPLYPQRLNNCYDAPALLYFSGNADLNASKMVCIIGTRNNTDYGKTITEKIVAELASSGVTILSGLAAGIDSIAHKAALQHQLATVGVLGHGLDSIYPSNHQSLAKDMLQNGGLLTEFKKGTIPDAFNFPRRNRIVAGMSDVVIVIESALKGGSMITANMAFQYNKDLYAVPGKTTDAKSAGCLQLIQQNKAMVFTNTEELLTTMGWQSSDKKAAKKQRELFIELTPDEQIIMDILNLKEQTHIDEIRLKSGLNSSSIAAAILDLELQNIIYTSPGKMYKIL